MYMKLDEMISLTYGSVDLSVLIRYGEQCMLISYLFMTL